MNKYGKKPPVCLQVLPSLPRVNEYPLQEFKVRIVKYSNSPKLLDIREFVTSPNFTGYSPKGISLTVEQFEYLMSMGETISVGLVEDTVLPALTETDIAKKS